MSKNMILGLDLDGVVYDYHSCLYTYCQYTFDYDGSYLDFWLNYFPNLPSEKQEYLVSIPMLYEMRIPDSFVMGFLEKSKRVFSEIFYVTGRGNDLKVVTERYLKKYDFPFYDNVIITRNKGLWCSNLQITHFIDDFPCHVISASRVCDAYLLNRPWNSDFVGDVNRIASLNEFWNYFHTL